MATTITLTSNPWRLPSGSVYLEGGPSPEEAERESHETLAARAAWKPSTEAWALLDRIRAALDRKVVAQAWDVTMYWSEEEAPWPMRALCRDVVTREDEGHVQAYLVLEGVEIIKKAHGYDGRATYLRQEDGRVLMSIAEICELTIENRAG